MNNTPDPTTAEAPYALSHIHTTALDYAARGWRVLPLYWPIPSDTHTLICACSRGIDCGTSTGKHSPLDDWPTVASSNPQTIASWWGRWPQANVGIIPGAHMAVLDVDPRNGGNRSLDALTDQHGPLPDTPLVLTGGGGRHYYFACDTPLHSLILAPGIDFLTGDSHLLVAPPSVHGSGQCYLWEASSGLDDMSMAPLPPWLLALVQDCAHAYAQQAVTLPTVLPQIALDSLRISARARRVITIGDDPELPYPSRSEALWAALHGLIRAGCDDATIAAVLLDPAHGISDKPLTQRQPRSPHYWDLTRGWMASEIARARAKDAEMVQTTTTTTAPDASTESPESPSTNTEEHQVEAQTPTDPELPYSDYTNALAFVREHGTNLRYCYDWKRWLRWQGTHWEPDTSGAVIRAAKQTIKRLARQVEWMDDKPAIDALLRHIKSSLAMAKLKAMVECAQSELGIPVAPADLDTHRILLNCRNGTLDLRTGTLQDHIRGDLLTKCLPIDYDPDAQCSVWKAFLWRIMKQNTALITFLQRAIGYSLTGDTSEQCLFMLYGTGSNGKSTFLEVPQALLGEYAQSTPSSTLLVKHGHEGIPNDIARLRGARFVSTVEIGEGKRLNEELLKRLTGQDTLTARFMRAEFFDFHGEFKLWIACNHRPIIQGTDYAIKRRIKLIPFEVTIPDEEQDKDLPAKLQAELPGILAWAVRGCLRWQAEGLGVPDEVKTATQNYFDTMDVLGGFLAECCLVDSACRVKFNDLYDTYKRWCEQNREEIEIPRKFSAAMTDRGFQPRKNNSINWRLGLGIVAAWRDAQGKQSAQESTEASTSTSVP